jgi:hypothetical protein
MQVYLHALLVSHAMCRVEPEDEKIVDLVHGPDPATNAEQEEHQDDEEVCTVQL